MHRQLIAYAQLHNTHGAMVYMVDTTGQRQNKYNCNEQEQEQEQERFISIMKNMISRRQNSCVVVCLPPTLTQSYK